MFGPIRLALKCILFTSGHHYYNLCSCHQVNKHLGPLLLRVWLSKTLKIPIDEFINSINT